MRPYHYKQGFTLIELLVVIIIIGIVSSATLYALGDFGASRKATATAEQIKSYLALLQHRAIITSTSLALRIKPHRYETFWLKDNKDWQAMPKNSFFHPQNLPKPFIMQLKLTTNAASSDIMIFPTGGLTPFILTLGTAAQPKLVEVSGQTNGDVQIIYEKR